MSRNGAVVGSWAYAGPRCIVSLRNAHVGRRWILPSVEQLQVLIQQHSSFGYRQLWAPLRFQAQILVNRKVVYRVLKQKRWLVHQRPCTPRPRVRGWVSRACRSNERCAMDVTHIPCGRDGWAHLAAVIDCHDREVIGYELAWRSRAKEAERAVENGVHAAPKHGRLP